MSSLTFKELIIFSPVEELAKIIRLQTGLNVITSRQMDGSDLGKSIIAKSFYHCLGADCNFDSSFDAENKVFIVRFEHEDTEYISYRNKSLFKLFDSNYDIIWSTSSRHELGQYYYDRFGFAIWLSARGTGDTEIAPPAYSFAPYFIDQNEYVGSEFRSFQRLGQYQDYKGKLIYAFTDVYDREYFEVVSQKDALSDELSDVETQIATNESVSDHVAKELSDLGYSANMATLSKDCDKHETDYKHLSKLLSGLRDKLYELREKRAQTKMALDGAEALSKRLDKRIKKFDGDICPFCSSHVEDPIATRVTACVAHTDALLLCDDLIKELDDIDRSIARFELQYKQQLNELETLRVSICAERNTDMTAMQIEGLTKFAEKLTNESGRLQRRKDNLDESIKLLNKRLRGYSDDKSAVNKRYVEIVTSYAEMLKLPSDILEGVETVTNRFGATGSNAPLATVAWYCTLLKLKDEFNPDRVCLPVIMDSPMNAEADDEKHERQYGLIFNVLKGQHQVLVTGLGLAESEYVPSSANVIVLENEKYHLLNHEDFVLSRDIVFECMQQYA